MANANDKSEYQKPSWILSSVTDMDARMKKLVLNAAEEEDTVGDTFAERAESYYHKRPQLLALLHDLYNAYVSLADRYTTLAKSHHHHHRRSHSSVSFVDEGGDGGSLSDAESSLSYQQTIKQMQPKTEVHDMDAIVTELVIKSVEFNILQHEFSSMERQCDTRKVELQKSLLEVLESERLILLNENARLGYKVSTLIEENKGLAAESMFMKRKASELARCVLKMRDDQRVCLLSRRIEDLQGQMYGLEKRNKEYYEQLVKTKSKKRNEGALGGDGVVRMLKEGGGAAIGNTLKDRRKSSLWGRLKRFDLFACGPHPTTFG